MKKIQAFLILITTTLCMHGFVTKAHAQITHIQFDPTNKDSFSYQEQHLTTGNLSLPNFNVDNTSTVELKAPGFSYMTVVPNGPAILQLSQRVGDITKILKEKKTRELIQTVIKLFPKKNQKILEQIDKTGYELLNTLTSQNSLFLPSPTPSIFHISPSPSTTPHSSPVPSPSPTPAPTPPPTIPMPSPLPTPLQLPPSYPSRIEVVDLLACPETGQAQWIKLFNPDHQEYTLHKWHFYNSHNHKRVLTTSIGSEGTITVYFRSHLFLKAGDTISLVRPDNIVSFTIQTPACSKKQAQEFFPPQSSLPPSQSQYTAPAPQAPTQSEQQLPQNVYIPPILQSSSAPLPQNYDFASNALETPTVQTQSIEDPLTDPQATSEGIGSSVLSEQVPGAVESASTSGHVFGNDMIVRPPINSPVKTPTPLLGIVLLCGSILLLTVGGIATLYFIHTQEVKKHHDH